MRIFVSITACNANKKKTPYGKEKNGEKPKIIITESVKIGNHYTVFSVGESPNLKPSVGLVLNGYKISVFTNT